MNVYIFYFLLWYVLSEGGLELGYEDGSEESTCSRLSRPFLWELPQRGRQWGTVLLYSSWRLFLHPFICTL